MATIVSLPDGAEYSIPFDVAKDDVVNVEGIDYLVVSRRVVVGDGGVVEARVTVVVQDGLEPGSPLTLNNAGAAQAYASAVEHVTDRHALLQAANLEDAWVDQENGRWYMNAKLISPPGTRRVRLMEATDGLSARRGCSAMLGGLVEELIEIR